MYLHALSILDEIKPKLLKEQGYNYAILEMFALAISRKC